MDASTPSDKSSSDSSGRKQTRHSILSPVDGINGGGSWPWPLKPSTSRNEFQAAGHMCAVGFNREMERIPMMVFFIWWVSKQKYQPGWKAQSEGRVTGVSLAHFVSHMEHLNIFLIRISNFSLSQITIIDQTVLSWFQSLLSGWFPHVFGLLARLSCCRGYYLQYWLS